MARRAESERRAFWQELIEDQSASGLSVLRFCLNRGVSTASFYGWKRRLAGAATRRGQSAKTIKAKAIKAKAIKTKPGSPSFVAIDLPALASVPSAHCEVLLVDGRRVRVPTGFDRESLIALFAALGETA
jgi:hypothetical protein